MTWKRLQRSLCATQRHSKALVAMPFALIAAVTVMDVSAPPDVHLGPFLVAAPAVTSSFAGPRMTGFVGAVAVLAQSVVAFARTSINDLNHTYQIIALCLISAFVTVFAHLREQHEKEMTQLRSVAEAAQHVLMQPLPRRSGPLRIASLYLAAEAEAQLGGDLYALARTADGTRLIVGDARGKGLDAIGEAAGVLGAFRALAHKEAHLPDLVGHLEDGVTVDRNGTVEGAGGGQDAFSAEAFVTAAVLDIPDAAREVRLVSCGHPPPLLLRAGRVHSLDVYEPAPPLGLAQLLAPAFTEETFGFDIGDVLLLYTDGVLESRDASGCFYPLSERVAARPREDPEALLKYVCADLLRHAGGRLGDDAAMVAIERLPDAV
ncbi:serine/threonine-protein phosphatase [Streptomyces sp. JH14]|uniref:PP2C family protein-serine/threonine phosphatase n=1 Tax=Streptomyces sp. JH14 TaxID=2793630 RepID=UPI0023F61E6D|nr:PP2C family protein-serine/threonine phosphatase [Streptomyces sp. JH14]MDF6040949.1 serine/threonine-protein phosphatase [Streptomyces sp. JH14]